MDKGITETSREELNQEKVKEVIDHYFPKGDKRRGDAMIIAGISVMVGREEMRHLILGDKE